MSSSRTSPTNPLIVQQPISAITLPSSGVIPQHHSQYSQVTGRDNKISRSLRHSIPLKTGNAQNTVRQYVAVEKTERVLMKDRKLVLLIMRETIKTTRTGRRQPLVMRTRISAYRLSFRTPESTERMRSGIKGEWRHADYCQQGHGEYAYGIRGNEEQDIEDGINEWAEEDEMGTDEAFIPDERERLDCYEEVTEEDAGAHTWHHDEEEYEGEQYEDSQAEYDSSGYYQQEC
ncbi:hypothetical protein QBC44DRAFT_374248 [Cladorrhinum sp. PSN332]|nr:hypothetical protein QBC44DRAFT_374248 [Cladorrhinum sp. PSN332]